MTHFSSRVKNLHASPIREVLAVIDKPGMISFAGGLPSSDTFPELNISVIPPTFLQYGPSEGEEELRAEISKQLQENGLHCDQKQVLILSGSQQGIDLVAKLFIDPGTKVAVESPTYLAALQVFNFFGANLIPLDLTKPGLGLLTAGAPALTYVIPTFQNPTGYCYSKSEREHLGKTCDDNGSTLFEDDPYRDLMYEDCDRTPICSLLKRSSWIYQSSFSKSLAPGLRLGFLACSTDLIKPLMRLKQAADLHSNRLSQWLVLKQIQDTEYKNRLIKLANTYKGKKDSFEQLLNEYLSEYAQWQSPSGGLFFWLKLTQKIDTSLLLEECIKQNIAFMPGQAFFAEAEQSDSFIRLNFSHASTDKAEKGLIILAKLIKYFFKSAPHPRQTQSSPNRPEPVLT